MQININLTTIGTPVAHFNLIFFQQYMSNRFFQNVIIQYKRLQRKENYHCFLAGWFKKTLHTRFLPKT